MRSLALLAAAAVLAACSSHDRSEATVDSASGSLAPATSGTVADTGVGSMGAVSGAPSASATGGTAPGGATDSASATAPAGGSDSAARAQRGNQTESGVTDTRTGASTLGAGVTKTRPDQGQATTSKGDTVARTRPPR